MHLFLQYTTVLIIHVVVQNNVKQKNLRKTLDLCLKITSPIIATTTAPTTPTMAARIPAIIPIGTGLVAIGVP